ncbi:fimbrial protein [Pseudomonas psychrophila]|uniref:fimbrial protein n=1 Tax=Pseudomonas psychrophila TaxID=122355 RepID=UPI0002D55C9B|nr:fimbrial protein [Pseudomonas psychrophila]
MNTNTFTQRLIGLIGLALCFAMSTATAAQAVNTCYWTSGAGPLSFTPDVGAVYVPRDAPLGSIIGTVKNLFTDNAEGGALGCTNDSLTGTVLSFNAIASAPIFMGPLPPMPGTVLHTNIPGVGIRIELQRPLVKEGAEDNSFIALNGPYVPMDAEHRGTMGSANFAMSNLRHQLTLIKIGTLAPGVHTLNGAQLFSGHFSGIGKAFTYGVTGTVVQAQCSLSGSPVSADPVQLGSWDSTHFTQEGDVTDAVDFHINLINCEADPTNTNIATANIRLEGAKGSMVFDAAKGIFTLASSATAKGVGIQMLRADGLTPIALGVEVPVIAIQPGNTVMDFKARMYQTHPADEVESGSVEGALNFTLTYK